MLHNDFPYRKGDRVSVIRTRHGWHDGTLSAVVVSAWQTITNVWQYRVKDSEGIVHEVLHTRDMRKAQ